MPTSPSIAGAPVGRRRELAIPAVAGIAYTVSWLIGLSVAEANPKVSASAAQVLASYSGHLVATTAQFILTEAVPAIGLAIVVVALARAAVRAGSETAATYILGAGLLAAAVSFVQAIVGVAMTSWAVPDGHGGGAHVLFQMFNRLDGVKMFALAGLAMAAAILAKRKDVLPRRLRHVSIALAVTIAASGAGYLLLVDSLAILAFVSGPILLVWVTSTGILLGRAVTAKVAA